MASSRVLPLLSREDIASRILAGDNIVIYHSVVLSIPHHWLSAHPGGALSILHFVGRDATDEIDAFHNETVRKQVRGYTIGRVEMDEKLGWVPFIPPFEIGWVRKLDERTGRLRWIREAQALFADAELPQSQIFLVSSGDLVDAECNGESDAKSADAQVPTIESIRMPATSLSAAVQTRHSIAYKELHDLVISEGFYDTPYITGYGPEFVRYTLLAILSYICYQNKYFAASAIFLGLVWHQLTFLAHDLGHMGVTHNWTLDRLFGIIVADFIGGLSIGWWVHNHNVHHLVTNHPSHDPDIEHLPFFAISPMFLNSLYSSYYDRLMRLDLPARIFLSVQHKLFYVVMSLARFNLYANSYVYLAKEKLERRFVVKTSDAAEDQEQSKDQPAKISRKQVRKARGGEFGGWSWWLEVVGIVFFWTWYIYVLRGIGGFWPAIRYVLISHIVTSPLHVQIVLSHFSRSTDDLGPSESFFDRQLRTTIDVLCPPSLAFIHGGLHLQVTHHLFPRLPRHNLLRASMLVKEYAKREGLEYAEFKGFWAGESEVRGVLGNVAEVVRQVGIVRGVAGEEVRKVVERVEGERREREKLRMQKEAELEKLISEKR